MSVPSMDIANVGVVILLKSGIDSESGRVVQPVHLSREIDRNMLHDIKRASHDLDAEDMPHIVVVDGDNGTVNFEFPPGTSKKKTTKLVEIILNELGNRLARHQWFAENGPATVVYATTSNTRE